MAVFAALPILSGFGLSCQENVPSPFLWMPEQLFVIRLVRWQNEMRSGSYNMTNDDETAGWDQVSRRLQALLRQERRLAEQHAERVEWLEGTLRVIKAGDSGLDAPSSNAASHSPPASLSRMPSRQNELEAVERPSSASGPSTKELAVVVLRGANRPMRARDLVPLMVEEGWGHDIANPENAISTALSRLNDEADQPVHRVGRGQYAYAEPSQKMTEDAEGGGLDEATE